jgi:hypothetical protein
MTTLSICAICQDEAEVIVWYLDCCVYTYKILGDKWLKEVVIVDGGSVDGTLAIIKTYQDKLPLILIEHPFDTFGSQKNRALALTTGDYVFFCDSDMTWTTNFGLIFKSGFYEKYEMVDFRMLFTALDEYHYHKWKPGVNMRLWANKGRRFVTGFHEKLQDQIGMGGLPVCEHVWLFENSMRQSDKALLHRGERYQQFAAQMEIAGAAPGPIDRYLKAKNEPLETIAEIPLILQTLILPQVHNGK